MPRRVVAVDRGLVRFEGDGRSGSRSRHARPDHRRRDDDPGRHRRRRARASPPATSWRGWPARCRSPSSARRPTTCRSHRRRPRASSAAAWARPSPTSTTRGTAASPSSSSSSARARPVSAPARAAPACPTSAPGSPPGPATIPDPFTARPASRQITLAEASADTYVDAFRRTPLHDEHLAAGRPDGPVRWLVAAVELRRCRRRNTGPSARASRSATSSTLGKLVVSGPDVVELLERLYPCHVADIKPGRSRYALLLNERGHVMDDGMILRESETRFVLIVHVRWRRQRRDVGPRLDRRLGPPRPRPRPDDVARRDQRHRAAGGHAAAPRRPGRPAPLPRPRPRRRRRRPVPRHAPVVHRRGRLRAPPPGRSLRRAVAGAAGPRARTSGSGRTASRRCSGCGSRRAT